jgi:hypothetical protein
MICLHHSSSATERQYQIIAVFYNISIVTVFILVCSFMVRNILESRLKERHTAFNRRSIHARVSNMPPVVTGCGQLLAVGGPLRSEIDSTFESQKAERHSIYKVNH